MLKVVSLRDWARKTGLGTGAFWVTLVAGYILIAVGAATLLHQLGLHAGKLFVYEGEDDPYLVGSGALAYGLASCVACHGCFRRKRWGYGLTALLALPVLFVIWSQPHLGTVPKVVLTIFLGNMAQVGSLSTNRRANGPAS